jgi:hypothetical protein
MIPGFAQSEEEPAKQYKNEFGVDATAFVKEFLNFNQQYSSNSPIYYLTYRRHFKPGNLRFAIGGDYASQEIPPSFDEDSNIYHNHYSSLDFRIGWEWYNNLSKRWQVYYGIDLRPSFVSQKNDAPYFNGGYANGSEFKAVNIGAAPLLGFRFRLTNRLSLLTEAAFSFNYQTTSGKKYYIPVTSQYPALPDEEIPKTKRVFTSFSQPVSLTIAFDI